MQQGFAEQDSSGFNSGAKKMFIDAECLDLIYAGSTVLASGHRGQLQKNGTRPCASPPRSCRRGITRAVESALQKADLEKPILGVHPKIKPGEPSQCHRPQAPANGVADNQSAEQRGAA